MVRHTRAATNHRQHLLDHALAYANTGWPVIALQPGTNQPAYPDHTKSECDRRDPRCNSTNGHLGWEARTVTDPDRIARTWNDTPWGVGIACGPARLIVVELDHPTHTNTTGTETLRQLEADHHTPLPATFAVATPNGGRHLYYQTPPGPELPTSKNAIGPAINIWSTHAYVPAPPTITTNGDYQIIDDHEPTTLPDWFANLATQTTTTTRTEARAHARTGAGEAIAAPISNGWPEIGAPFQPPAGVACTHGETQTWERWRPLDWARIPKVLRVNAPWWVVLQVRRYQAAQADNLHHQTRQRIAAEATAIHGTPDSDPDTNVALLALPKPATAVNGNPT